jgi:hypothetical protein
VAERRRNFFWPLLLIFVGAVMLLQVLGVMPLYLWDLLVRLWPLLLIIFGLAALVSRRTPATNALVLIGLFALVVVVLAAGYTRQALRAADDNRQTIDHDLGDARDVHIALELGLTELTVGAQEEATGRLLGEFVGSTETQLEVSYTRRGNRGELRISEQSVHPLPLLESFGSNRLALELPPQLPLTLDCDGNVGSIQLDLSGLDMDRLEVRASLGELTVTLPGEGGLIGDISTGQGDVTVRVPETMAMRFEVSRGLGGGLQIPSGLLRLEGGVLMTEGYSEAHDQVNLNVGTTFGDIIIEYAE